ncbi:response regulator [Pseudanabaena biceps]|nr:response regulator [Pseudanabaena biceps]
MFVLSQKRLKPIPRILSIIIVALLYYGMAEISRHVAATPQDVTPVWPPDGFASAAILIFGFQLLPGVLIGSFLANIWAFFNADSWYMEIFSILQVLGIAIGTTIGTGLGNYLLRRSINGRNPFRRLDDLYKFLGFTGALAPMINATAGVLCLCLGGQIPWSIFGTVWITWWVSNVAGICIFTPAIISWYKFYVNSTKHKEKLLVNWKTEAKKIRFRRVIEAIILIVITLEISFLSFYQNYPLSYTLIPCLIFAVNRFGDFGATNLIVVITTISVLGTVKGLSSFAIQYPDSSLVLLQCFIVVVVLTTLSLIAILSEKKQAIANLQKSKVRLINKSVQLKDNQAILNENALILEQKNIALTESKKVAESASLVKSEFLSNMSHELRTPLNAILGLTQVLQTSKNLDHEEQSDLKTVIQSGAYLLELIDDILDISKIEAGKMELQFQNIDFLQFLTDLVNTFKVQINHKNIDFDYQFSPDLPQFVYIDSKRLRQVLFNLLSNAIKFTTKGSIILRVIASKSNKSQLELEKTLISISFEVEDSGIGIDVKRLESIFLPFERAEETKFKIQGTGLGLAISQKIVMMMGGEINVSSKYGVGSIFGFTVCLEIPKTNISDKHDIPNKLASNTNIYDKYLAQKLPLRILLAEDNPINQLVASKILNRLGYEIEIADNGVQVLEAMQNRNYDVILMDMQMPEMDGIEATKHIVGNTDLACRPYIIALTANVMDSDRQICMDAGMDDFISKPVNVDSLTKALWRSLRQGT